MSIWKKTEIFGKFVIKWVLLGILLGVLGGLLGTTFHISVDVVTEQREHHKWLIYLLPLGGLLIAAMYRRFRRLGNLDTKRVFQAVKEQKDVPVIMIPLIFLGTVITHAFGGSAGREGAALQLGGSMGYNVGQVLKQDGESEKLMVTAGMSSVFSALFGTPLTAAVFSLEATRVGMFRFCGLLPGLVSSLIAYFVSQFLGVAPVRFAIPSVSEYQWDVLLKVIVLGILCAAVCILFAWSLHKTEYLGKKILPNSYFRGMIGGFVIVGLTLLVGTTDYNGAGMGVIQTAMSGTANFEAFFLKILFTAITVAAGFKGGEIVPTFFIGATFGCMASGLLGLDPAFAAGLGFVALFSGMTKCPIAALLLAMEVFGMHNIFFFLLVIVASYFLSGRFGLYHE